MAGAEGRERGGVLSAGQLLPHSREVEIAVLSGLLYRPERFRELDELAATDFYLDTHRAIFQAMHRLADDGESIDEAMLEQRLGTEWERCMTTVASLGSFVFSWEPSGWIRELRTLAMRRKAIQEALRLVREATDGGDMALALGGHLARLGAVADGVPGVTRWKSFEEVVESSPLPVHEHASKDELDPTLLHLEPAGLFGRGTLTLVVARTGHGKSAFAIQVAAANARKGRVCGYFSLEMGGRELLFRMLSGVTATYTAIRRGLLTLFERQEAEAERKRLRSLPLFVDDRERLSIDELCSGVRALQRRERNLRLVVVDYLSLLDLPGTERDRHDLRLGTIAQRLAALSRSLDLSVILACQLGRGAEKGGGEPSLADIANSDAVAHPAYAVVSVWQPEGEQAWVRVLKNRGGPRPRVPVKFDGPHQTFEEMPMPEPKTPRATGSK